MNQFFLKSKIHGAIVTHSEKDYDGSCAIDVEILNQASVKEYEKIDINYSFGPGGSTETIKCKDCGIKKIRRKKD